MKGEIMATLANLALGLMLLFGGVILYGKHYVSSRPPQHGESSKSVE